MDQSGAVCTLYTSLQRKPPSRAGLTQLMGPIGKELPCAERPAVSQSGLHRAGQSGHKEQARQEQGHEGSPLP